MPLTRAVPSCFFAATLEISKVEANRSSFADESGPTVLPGPATARQNPTHPPQQCPASQPVAVAAAAAAAAAVKVEVARGAPRAPGAGPMTRTKARPTRGAMTRTTQNHPASQAGPSTGRPGKAPL
jgi:hypothetical protein